MAALWSAAALVGSLACGDPPLPPACDVALRPDGSLSGRIVPAAERREDSSLPAFRVRLFREGRVVAETASDRRGTFLLQHLGGGLYHVVVDSPAGGGGRCCRLWPASIAPPGGLQELTVVAGDPLVRGQGPLPPASIPTAAVLTAIAAGAIAAPAIYNNAKSEPHIPASP